jgi:hypothetical protein
MVRSAALALAALVVAPGASAEIVARGVQDGSLSLAANGQPVVAYIKGRSFVISTRVGQARWQAQRVGTVAAGSEVVAFKIGPAGPVALVERGDLRKLTLYRRNGFAWQAVKLGGALPGHVQLGLPGLAFDTQGRAVVAYTRWSRLNYDSRLLLARIERSGKIKQQQITREGFPKSVVPPPAAPVFVGGRVHVVESYGYRGVVGTIEWYPDKKTWTGLFIDAGVGDYPVGPVLAGLGHAGTLFAAWTESLDWFSDAPVTLAQHANEMSSKVVLDRALTTGLALPQSGPEVAANEWVGAGDLGLGSQSATWAGMIVRGRQRVELDGWIAAYGLAPRGARDVLLGGPSGLSWFRAPTRPSTRMTIEATSDGDGRAHVTGRVAGVVSGKVAIYRERPGFPRQLAGRASISGSAFSFNDRSAIRPLLYRAVYTDPATGIPFAALLRNPLLY